jgi:hypothetical protein
MEIDARCASNMGPRAVGSGASGAVWSVFLHHGNERILMMAELRLDSNGTAFDSAYGLPIDFIQNCCKGQGLPVE